MLLMTISNHCETILKNVSKKSLECVFINDFGKNHHGKSTFKDDFFQNLLWTCIFKNDFKENYHGKILSTLGFW